MIATTDAAPPPTDWTSYIGTYVRRSTNGGAVQPVKLLQVKGDAAHVGRGKHMKPTWVPLKELSPGVVTKKARRSDDKPRGNVPYVICDTQHHRWLVTGRGTDTHWVQDVTLATSYPNINGAWAARRYHHKKRPQLFGAHVDVVPQGEATAWAAKWGKASAAHAPAAELSQKLIRRELPEPAKPETATAAPTANVVSAELVEAWSKKRRELGDAQQLLAGIESEFAVLDAALDIAMAQRGVR